MFKKLRARRSFQKALRAAGEDEMVCGTLDPDGRPLYFVMPRSATDAEVRAEAFRQRYGRRMNPLEEKLLLIAEARARRA